MDITPVVAADRQLINGYGDLGFTISGVRHEGSVVVFPDRTLSWPIASMDHLAEDSFRPILEAETRPGILLLGCGSSMALPPRPLRAFLKAQGVIVEFMDTGAAARTYNVLLTEGRDVAAALIAI